MKKRLPPLNWLRSFEASARHLSFTQAAVEMNLTQASISQQIRGLEHQLGVSLFKRLPRGLELTEAGMAYLPAVHESIERLVAATDEIFGQNTVKRLSIRSSLVFFTHWLAPRLTGFRKLHSDIVLNFTSNIWVNQSDVEDDMEIRYGKGDWKGLKSIRLTWDDLIPVCSSTLDNSLPPPMSPEELSQHTLLHVVGYEEGWGYWLNKTGYSDIDSSKGIQMDTLVSALEMASLGQGIALGRTSIVTKFIDDGRLIAPLSERVPTSEGFYLVYSEEQFEHPHAEIFRKWLIEESQIFRNSISAN